jgi:hypothetical protein
VPGFRADDAGDRFARGSTLFGHFQAMVHRVAKQMREGSFEPLQHVAINRRVFAGHLECGLLPEGPCQVAHPLEATSNAGAA